MHLQPQTTVEELGEHTRKHGETIPRKLSRSHKHTCALAVFSIAECCWQSSIHARANWSFLDYIFAIIIIYTLHSRTCVHIDAHTINDQHIDEIGDIDPFPAIRCFPSDAWNFIATEQLCMHIDSLVSVSVSVCPRSLIWTANTISKQLIIIIGHRVVKLTKTYTNIEYLYMYIPFIGEIVVVVGIIACLLSEVSIECMNEWKHKHTKIYFDRLFSLLLNTACIQIHIYKICSIHVQCIWYSSIIAINKWI